MVGINLSGLHMDVFNLLYLAMPKLVFSTNCFLLIYFLLVEDTSKGAICKKEDL